MNLNLSVISFHRFTADIKDQISLNGTDESKLLTIGRSEQCLWCLPDPERVISSQHARIEIINGQFCLFDTSTNGTFVNRSVESITQSKPYVLCDGDLIAIGEYEIQVRISAATGQSGREKTVHGHQKNRQASYADMPPVIAHSEHDEHLEFGVKVQPLIDTHSRASLAASATSLDSVLNSNLDDALVFPNQDRNIGIPEDWQSINMTAPVGGQELTAAVQEAPAHKMVDPVLVSDARPADMSVSAPQSHQSRDVSSNEAALLNAFLEGLGVSKDLVSQDNPMKWWKQLGGITRDSLDGLMTTLHNRSSFKESSRINQTTFRRNENNPLKFSANTEDALYNLLLRNSAGFMPPERAIKEAFLDLERHETALHEAHEGSIKSFLTLFEPNRIESENQYSGRFEKYSNLFEKQKYWKRYCHLFEQIRTEINDDNREIYMDDFVKAYEQSLKRMQ